MKTAYQLCHFRQPACIRALPTVEFPCHLILGVFFFVLKTCPEVFFFNVLLTAHLGIILVNDQLDAQFFFRICSFQISTCFEHSCAHRQYDIWYMSLYVGDNLVCKFGWNSTQTCIPDGHLHRVTYTRCHIDTILLMMSTRVLETCRDLE